MDPFDHQALFYAGRDEFVLACSSFLRDGIAAGEPALVMVGAAKLDALREELGPDAEQIMLVDMEQAGANPAWIIPRWREFAEAHHVGAQRLRGIGEPIWAERTPAELIECQRHEALLNYAFADADGFTLLCPYDTDALTEDVIAEARRSHPCLVHDGCRSESTTYRGTEESAAPFDAPLPEPGGTVYELPFGLDTIDSVRAAVARHAGRAGIPERRREDLVLAVNEIATNSVRHGGGYGRLRMWAENGSVICEVRDRGRILEPLAGREQPSVSGSGGYGLWLANRLCDLVQVRAFPGGGAVRVHVRG